MVISYAARIDCRTLQDCVQLALITGKIKISGGVGVLVKHSAVLDLIRR